MRKTDDIYLPSTLFDYKYNVYSTMKDIEKAHYIEQRDKFLKYITAKPRRRKRK